MFVQDSTELLELSSMIFSAGLGSQLHVSGMSVAVCSSLFWAEGLPTAGSVH